MRQNGDKNPQGNYTCREASISVGDSAKQIITEQGCSRQQVPRFEFEHQDTNPSLWPFLNWPKATSANPVNFSQDKSATDCSAVKRYPRAQIRV